MKLDLVVVSYNSFKCSLKILTLVLFLWHVLINEFNLFMHHLTFWTQIIFIAIVKDLKIQTSNARLA